MTALFKWKKDPRPKFRRAKDTFQKKVLKKAVTAGIKAVRPDLKSAMPKRTGALRSSIGSKTGGKKAVYGVIGPRTKYKKFVRVKSTSKRRGLKVRKGKLTRLVQPSRYHHLVEYGTKNITPRYNLKRAFSTKQKKYVAVMMNVIKPETAKALGGQ